MRMESRFGLVVSIAAAAGMAIAGPASAQIDSSGTFKTGDELYAQCTSTDEAEVDACDWYIMGVQDAIILHQDLEWVEKAICIPVGTTAEDLRERVVAYLENSDDRSFSAVSMVYNSIEADFPC